MGTEYRLPPSAASLSASMRDIGYSLETAVADIVDNSISADASNISIFCNLAGSEPTLTIIDDGKGMSADELRQAMRHGATNPKQKRPTNDLGRFGLGLKTASFSQCRKLTVISRQNEVTTAAEWDLDLIDERDDWILTILEPDEISALPNIDNLGSTGTIVLWRMLDRLAEDEIGDKRQEVIAEKLDVVSRHLSLVFHRFLSGEIKDRKVTIRINGHPIDVFDPFCRKNSATQVLETDYVRFPDGTVTIQPYVLPHHSRLTASEYDFYQDRSDFISNQGAYVYRGGRLMAWGDWFRLVPKGEATKLARVQIDFPNTLDERWTIDIKKSRARPPFEVREQLRRVIQRIQARSITVHRGRGQKLFVEIKAPVWDRFADQNSIRYQVNRDHPVVLSSLQELSKEQQERVLLALDVISSSLPVEMIYSDYSTNPREFNREQLAAEAAVEKLKALKLALFPNGGGRADQFRNVLTSTRVFDGLEALTEKFIGEEFHE